jgi:nuclear GTP-binding protein
MRIVDSPGVVFDDDEQGTGAGNVLLRNVVRVEDIDDPVSVGMQARVPHFFHFLILILS